MCSVTEQSMPSYVLTVYYLIISDQFLNYRELITLKISDMKLWNLLCWKKTKRIPLNSFRVKVTNDWRYIFVIFIYHRMDEIEGGIWLSFDGSEGLQRAIVLFGIDIF